MARIARAVAVEFPHHVTQRGNFRQSVFKRDQDFSAYLDWLKIYSEKYRLKIWAYCLMRNHVHYVAVPQLVDSLARTFNTLHMRYSQYANKRVNANGHLWQGRFFSCALDEAHLFAAVRYVENNPVRAGIVQKAEEYKWSSARAHTRGVKDAILSGDCYLENEIKNWKAYLQAADDKTVVKNIRQHTKTGWPCGNDVFLNKIEHLLGRQMSANPRGRPIMRK